VRIERLGLAAYGPFSGFELDFAGARRVELVFGANEAGKSTALRAVRGLLFGIPEQTGDAHRHPAAELAIEASLSNERGDAVFVRRRRKRKESLRDRKDEPLAEEVLARLLGGIDAAAFERLFAFDHDRLAASAEEMLKGKGDVGEALFAAGAGSSAVGAVLRQLEYEASEIFTPLARTRPLNALIKEYRSLQAELRKTRLLPDAYLAQRESLLRAEEESERIRAERLRLEAELAKLSRVERALPWLARLRSARSELSGQQLPAVSVAEVSERRLRAERERDAARSELRHLVAEQERDRERLERIGKIPDLVEVPESTLLALLGAMDAVRAARLELPERRAQLSLLNTEVLELSSKLGLGAEPHAVNRVRVDGVARVRRLLADYAVLVEAEQHLMRRRNESARRLEQIAVESESDCQEVLERLESAVAEAKGARDFAERARDVEQLVERLERESARARARLLPAPPDRISILDWVVPTDETLERLAAQYSEVEARLLRVRERSERASERYRRVGEERERMELSLALPTEADLTAAREARDALVRGLSLAGQNAGFDALQMLARAIGRCDEIADRLRREATRVSELVALRAESNALAQELEALKAEQQALERGREAVVRENRAAFEALGIEPLPPAEMRAWLGRYREALRPAVELETARQRLREIRAEGERLTALLGELRELGESKGEQPLGPGALFNEAARRLERLRARQKARLEAEQRQASARAELALVEAELSVHANSVNALKEQLERARAELGVPPGVSPEELAHMLDGLSNLSDRLQQTARTRLEIEALERRAAEFDAQVASFTQRYAPDLTTLPAESALPALAARQRDALAREREQRSLREKLAELEARQTEREVSSKSAEAALSELAESLGLASEDELPNWEALAQRIANSSARLAEAERELLALGDGRSLEELAAEAEPHSADEIAPLKREIAEELERLEQAAYQARRDAEGLQAGLLLLGGQNAADAAQRLSEVAAAIREQARHYAELRVAQGILSRELSSYRDRNQGPILERASDLFARFTLGSFSGLRVGLEASVLECVRSTGQGLSVTELSEGVRYQLYFALRLASLERYLDRGQSLPLVLDDVFIHWDDERALAGFQVLGELSQRTQVLFFTHHAHLVDVAARALGPSMRRHALPAPIRAA
jgi:uncharacterized protein YhaN